MLLNGAQAVKELMRSRFQRAFANRRFFNLKLIGLCRAFKNTLLGAECWLTEANLDAEKHHKLFLFLQDANFSASSSGAEPKNCLGFPSFSPALIRSRLLIHQTATILSLGLFLAVAEISCQRA